MGRIATLLMSPVEALIAARGILFPWVPVFLGLGIGIWFSLRWEPGGITYALCLVLFIAAVGVRLRGPEPLHPFAIAVACMLLGGLAAGYRAHSLTAPILGFRFYGAVEGRIVLIDRSQSDKIRLTLDQVILENTPPQRTPERVRVSLHGVQDYLTPEPGQRVMATAHLAAPDGPLSLTALISAAWPFLTGWGRWATPARRSCCWSRQRRARSRSTACETRSAKPFRPAFPERQARFRRP